MRKKIIAGNWKMNKTVEEAIELANGVKRELADCTEVDVVLCPPFTAIKSVSDIVSETQIAVGSQNMSSEDEGAYTGEICHSMLKELFVRYVILGHSERREYYKETDEWINKKVIKALEKNLRPILCVGETLEDRESGSTEKVVEVQVREGLKNVAADAYTELVIAYEPVWAIGTGKVATAEQAQEVHAFIRATVKDMVGEEAANAVRIQYGGSMKPGNAPELLAQPDIDGGLIGGAALDAESFAGIVKAGM
ncbi:triose-phosphate isomerase [Pontiella agarivorans]|uniref:Triosephosphate isomerase n=1 Tax=Pontiella agarivorans TaxID=3038953 RepID=A0ABU5MT70_9BACT|nr:triose-phosphate isomerase [Pontiella agarivorans]MDZ8117410.1 triose-phosphate isomerase [Pontiella agarivorans]